MDIISRIESKSAKIGIIGLGYVGFPLAIAFARKGYDVVGFDLDSNKVALLNDGKSYIKHIPSEAIQEIMQIGKFHPTTDFSIIHDMDCILICVPTPLNKNREPDLSYVIDTTKTIAKYIRKDQLICLESSTYPGTTDEDMRTILETGGLKAGEDFYLAYSPEREDPNNKEYTISTIPKIVGGYTEKCTKIAKTVYDQIVVKTVPVSSTRVAEAAKILENTYRAVNIALVNELKMLFDNMNIDIYEVIEAAKTKPFGFQAFYPGPGLGGHCIPIDPFYLTWKAREYECATRFIELAGEVNTHMPYYVVQKTIEALNDRGVAASNAKILILGLAYKKDIDDTRESPSFKLIELLEGRGAKVDYNDPYVPRMPKKRDYDFGMESIRLTERNLATYDCVLIATNHSDYDYDFIAKHSKLVIDTRNATRNISANNIVKA